MPIVIKKEDFCKCGHWEKNHEEIEFRDYYTNDGKCKLCNCKFYDYDHTKKYWSDGKITTKINKNA